MWVEPREAGGALATLPTVADLYRGEPSGGEHEAPGRDLDQRSELAPGVRPRGAPLVVGDRLLRNAARRREIGLESPGWDLQPGAQLGGAVGQRFGGALHGQATRAHGVDGF